MKNKIPGRILAAYKKFRVLMISLITLILLLPSMALAERENSKRLIALFDSQLK